MKGRQRTATFTELDLGADAAEALLTAATAAANSTTDDLRLSADICGEARGESGRWGA